MAKGKHRSNQMKKLLLILFVSMFLVASVSAYAWDAELSNGLVSYYSMNTNSSTLVYDSLGINNATQSGTPPPKFYSGKVNNAVNLSSVNLNMLNITNEANFDYLFKGDQNFTISMWIYHVADAQDYEEGIIGKGLASGAATFFAIDTLDANNFNMYFQETGSNIRAMKTTSAPIIYNQWVHVVFVYTGGLYNSGWIFYQNGSLGSVAVKNSVGANPVISNDYLPILGAGYFNTENYLWNGGMDEVAIWNRTLNSSEVTKLYNNGNGITFGSLYVSSNSPSNNSLFLINENVTFNTTASSPNSLVNATIFINNILGGSFDLEFNYNCNCYNETKLISGVSNETIFNHNFSSLGVGIYNWYVKYCDSLGNCVDSNINRILAQDVKINSATYNINTYETMSETFTLNVTGAGSALTANLIYDGTSYAATNTGDNTNAIFNKTITMPSASSAVNKTFHWQIYYGTTEYNSSDYSQIVNPIMFGLCPVILDVDDGYSIGAIGSPNAAKYGTKITVKNNFTLGTVTKNSASDATVAYLQTADGTSDLVTANFVGNVAQINYSLVAGTSYRIVADKGGASMNLAGNTSLTTPISTPYFNIIKGINGGTEEDNQIFTWDYYSVNPGRTPYINYTFKDEATGLAMNASIDLLTQNYGLVTSASKQYLFTNTTANPSYAFCFSPADKSVVTEAKYLQYSYTNYPQRHYYASETLTNTTKNQVLYLLSTATGIYSSIQTATNTGNAISGVEILVERQFNGNWTVVEQGTTDSSGLSTFWLNPNYDHRYTTTKAGYVTQTVTIRPTQSIYTIIMSSQTGNATFVSPIEGVSYIKTPSSGVINPISTLFTFNVTSTKGNMVNCKFELTNSSGSVLQTASSACTSSANLSILYLVKSGEVLFGRYYVDMGSGYQLLESDGNWRAISVNGSQGSLLSFLNLLGDRSSWGVDSSGNNSCHRTIYNGDKSCEDLTTQVACEANGAGTDDPAASTVCFWGPSDDARRWEFSIIVIVFLSIAIFGAATNVGFQYDLYNPGYFVWILPFLLTIISITGLLTVQGATFLPFFDQYVVALYSWIIMGIITLRSGRTGS